MSISELKNWLEENIEHYYYWDVTDEFGAYYNIYIESESDKILYIMTWF